MIGERFGYRIVLSKGVPCPWRGCRWIVRCDCGSVRLATMRSLRTLRSCGCYLRYTPESTLVVIEDAAGAYVSLPLIRGRSKNKVTVGHTKVSPNDCERFGLAMHSWTLDSAGYASTSIDAKPVRLHRIILAPIVDGAVVDHVNRDPLDNRPHNIRITTQRINNMNRSSRSAHRGVFWAKKLEKWCAQAPDTITGKRRHLGVFVRLEDAIAARQEAERAVFGEVFGP